MLAKGHIISVMPARAVAPAIISGASDRPAGIPHRVIAVQKQPERVPIVPIIKDGVVSTPSPIETICDADEAPAFGMG